MTIKSLPDREILLEASAEESIGSVVVVEYSDGANTVVVTDELLRVEHRPLMIAKYHLEFAHVVLDCMDFTINGKEF